MFCPFCGTQNLDDARDCVQCARALPATQTSPAPRARPQLLRRPAPLKPAAVDGLPAQTRAPAPAPITAPDTAPPTPLGDELDDDDEHRPERDTLIESAPPSAWEDTTPPLDDDAPPPPRAEVTAPAKWRLLGAMLVDGALAAGPAALLATTLFGRAKGAWWEQLVSGVLLAPLGAVLFAFVCVAVSTLQHGPVFSALGGTIGGRVFGLTLRRGADENAPGPLARAIRGVAAPVLAMLLAIGPLYALWLSRSGRGPADWVARTRPGRRGDAR